MKQLIWYNPDSKEYQWGSSSHFKILRARSANKDAFTLLFKFNETNQSLAKKIIRELNSARKDESWESELKEA